MCCVSVCVCVRVCVLACVRALTYIIVRRLLSEDHHIRHRHPVYERRVVLVCRFAQSMHVRVGRWFVSHNFIS